MKKLTTKDLLEKQFIADFFNLKRLRARETCYCNNNYSTLEISQFQVYFQEKTPPGGITGEIYSWVTDMKIEEVDPINSTEDLIEAYIEFTTDGPDGSEKKYFSIYEGGQLFFDDTKKILRYLDPIQPDPSNPSGKSPFQTLWEIKSF